MAKKTRKKRKLTPQEQVYNPSPAVLEEKLAAIRDGWSEEERHRRRQYTPAWYNEPDERDNFFVGDDDED